MKSEKIIKKFVITLLMVVMSMTYTSLVGQDVDSVVNCAICGSSNMQLYHIDIGQNLLWYYCADCQSLSAIQYIEPIN